MHVTLFCCGPEQRSKGLPFFSADPTFDPFNDRCRITSSGENFHQFIDVVLSILIRDLSSASWFVTPAFTAGEADPFWLAGLAPFTIGLIVSAWLRLLSLLCFLLLLLLLLQLGLLLLLFLLRPARPFVVAKHLPFCCWALGDLPFIDVQHRPACGVLFVFSSSFFDVQHRLTCEVLFVGFSRLCIQHCLGPFKVLFALVGIALPAGDGFFRTSFSRFFLGGPVLVILS